jgi:hypothetical protein
MVAGSRMVVNGRVSGVGAVEIGQAGVLDLLHGAVKGQTVDFLAGTGRLDLQAASSFDGAIAGFRVGDRIDLVDTPADSLAFRQGVLTVRDGGSRVASLHFAGSYSTASFVLSSDHHGGSLIGLRG